MNDNLSIDNIGEEELREAKKVIYVNKNDRDGETITEAFMNRVKEIKDAGNTGYKREVVFPIPLELLEGDENIRKFIRTIGEISRDERIGLPIEMKQENVEGIKIVNLIFEPSGETNLKLIREKLNK